ncbi:MAG: 2,3-cyclic 3-phosphodiesterase [Blastocatellia bacterium]|nr:2,3-cyclic 3-phosphodiesterase [Blastocatellia bacterium]
MVHSGRCSSEFARKNRGLGGNVKMVLRLFTAIELPPAVRDLAARHAVQLRTAVPSARVSWEKPEKIHLTLKFFGETEERLVEPLITACNAVASRTKPFTVQVGDPGAFFKKRKPQVLWLGVSDAEGMLAGLYSAIERECEGVGFVRDSRVFHPHLTIARIRQPQGAADLARLHLSLGFAPISFLVNEFVLIKSDIGSTGSSYKTLSHHIFRQNSIETS